MPKKISCLYVLGTVVFKGDLSSLLVNYTFTYKKGAKRAAS